MKITIKREKKFSAGNVVGVSIVEGKKEAETLRLSDGRKIIELGVEKRSDLTRRHLMLLARKVIALAKQGSHKKISLAFSDFTFPHLNVSNEDLARLLAANFHMADFEFVKYKTPPKEGWNRVEEVIVFGVLDAVAERGFKVGSLIGEEVNRCRALANTPGGDMTPKLLAEEARKSAKGTPIKVSVLGKKEIEKLKMGGVLGVSKGSNEEPRFIILEYMKGGKEQPIVLVGKGVTFDTGGLNLKSTDHIYEMHMDMSGGAAVIHAVVAAAKLGLKKNIVGLVPAVENMPSGSSYHPGDVLTSLSGRTIEVLDTDAEGRIILADGLAYAHRYNPRLVVDVATLTGAAMVAVGQRACAIFTSDEGLEKMFRELGEESGDYVWPLPLWEEYEADIKGTFGDWANIGKNRYGGAITAAVFLKQFTKKEEKTSSSPSASGNRYPHGYPWVHIDIAPRMTAVEGEHLAKGAAGAPVRLLIRLLETF